MRLIGDAKRFVFPPRGLACNHFALNMTFTKPKFNSRWSGLAWLLALKARSSSAWSHHRLRGLQSAVGMHKVHIYVSLEYLREEVSMRLESKKPEDPVVSHFCKAVNYQVSFAYSSTITFLTLMLRQVALKSRLILKVWPRPSKPE